jgi:hypothetical protein
VRKTHFLPRFCRAITTGLTLGEAAGKFCREYRTFWPLTQLGDPLSHDDRMFDVDERSVQVILRKLEERYGKYDACSSTDRSANLFQKFDFSRPRTGLTAPVWCKNTRVPREHAERILRKYGVPSVCWPSQSPGIRMIDFIRTRRFVCDPEMALPADQTYDGAALTLGELRGDLLIMRSPSPTTRIGASPFRRGPPLPHSGRPVGGRSPTASLMGTPRTLPPLGGSPTSASFSTLPLSPGRGSPHLGMRTPREKRIPLSPMTAPGGSRASPASPTSVMIPRETARNLGF